MTVAAVSLSIAAQPLGAQAISERYTPEEFVSRLLAQRAGETVRYSAGATFIECPHESPWHNAVFMALKDRPEVGHRFSGALARARHRCDDPRLDEWMLEEIRRSTDPDLDPRAGHWWTGTINSYPTEILRQPEFDALFWEILRDERISEFTRGRAVSVLFRERSEAEVTQLIIRMTLEGVQHPEIAVRSAFLRWQWSNGYLTAVAEAIESRPVWHAMLAFMWEYPRETETDVSPAVRERFLRALRDAAETPRSDWPADGVAALRRLVDRIDG